MISWVKKNHDHTLLLCSLASISIHIGIVAYPLYILKPSHYGLQSKHVQTIYLKTAPTITTTTIKPTQPDKQPPIPVHHIDKTAIAVTDTKPSLQSEVLSTEQTSVFTDNSYDPPKLLDEIAIDVMVGFKTDHFAITMNIYVNDDGKAEYIEVLSNQLPAKITDSLLQKLYVANYLPAFANGKPVPGILEGGFSMQSEQKKEAGDPASDSLED